jgi:EAL domain-containing protein (putative c-di-GMP-specific phosphodiesterase class I)
VAVLYIGVDLFAKLIQSEGLTSGLEAVAGFAGPLREAAPPDAYIARVCDDAYALLLDNLRQADAVELAARIVEDARQPLAPGAVREGERVCATGTVLAEPGKSSATEILNMVYRDYLFGSAIPEPVQASSSHSLPAMPESGYHSELSEEDRQFAASIRRALEDDGFQLVYQPIVSLKGDSQENYNVFVRLRDDDKRLREAKEFLAAAVRSGRMVAIDRWVIRHAIEELAKQRAQERKLNFFVNLAEESLQEDKLLIWICDSLREYRARGSWLTFQILEDHARRHAAAFAKLCEGLKKVKCRVALNRFGLGPSPEVLLKGGHADFVKFAPELAVGLADDEAKQKRLLALTDTARENGMRSVFTGVEDARTLTVLWTAGIDYVQGNFLQKPQPTIEPL